MFAFTCGDGFSNSIVPTSGVLMAMLSLAGIPFEKWLRFMLPLFGLLMRCVGFVKTAGVGKKCGERHCGDAAHPAGKTMAV